MLEIIEDAVGFARLQGEWNDVLQSSASNSFFLTWEWLYTWWKYLGGARRLSILTVRSGPELVGVAPLAMCPPSAAQLMPFPSLQFLGTGSVGSDYLDLIVRRGRECDAIQPLVGYLAAEKRVVQLAQVQRSSSVAAEAAGQLRQRGWAFSDSQTHVCPLITLSGHTWESYLASLGAEHRYNFKRRLKNLTKQFDVRFQCVRSEEERRKALPVLLALHDMRWGQKGGSDAFHAPALLSFHEELSRLALARGWLRLFVLWLNDTPAASLYGFRYGRSFYFYQSGFDPGFGKHSVGLVSMALAIQSAIAEGADEYDFLHGDEQYKFAWAQETRALGRLELYPPHLRGRLYRRAVRLGRAARKMARRVLPHTVADRIARGAAIGV